jgi:hypothetical protein
MSMRHCTMASRSSCSDTGGVWGFSVVMPGTVSTWVSFSAFARRGLLAGGAAAGAGARRGGEPSDGPTRYVRAVGRSFYAAGRWGVMTRPSGSRSPVSSKISTPLHSAAHP